jgi:hypothetical protein
MMNDQPPPDESLGRSRVPLPIPSIHEPPPIPQRHEPPPVPASHQPPPVPATAGDRQVVFVTESASASLLRPDHNEIQGTKGELVVERAVSPLDVVKKEKSPPGESLVLPGLMIILATLCIPLCLFGALVTWVLGIGGAPFWISVLVCSSIVICLARYVRSQGTSRLNLVRLASQLSYGFSAVALIGLLVGVLQVLALFGAGAQDIGEAANGAVNEGQWVIEQVEGVKSFVGGIFYHDKSAASSPAPSPSVEASAPSR